MTEAQQTIWKHYLTLASKKQFRRSLERIAAETGVNEKTVRRANQAFKDLGLLDWKQGQGNHGMGLRGFPNLYKIIDVQLVGPNVTRY